MPAQVSKVTFSLLFLGGMAACDSGPGFVENFARPANQQAESAEQEEGADSNNQLTAASQGLVWDEDVWDEKKWQ